MTAAIYYHPEAYTTSGPKLMGRNAAGESFLRGFLQHCRSDRLFAQVQHLAHGQHFAQSARAMGRTEPVCIIQPQQMGVLSQAGSVYFPGPGLGEHAWQRSAFGSAAWSLCGITHTTSSARAMDAIVDLITAPVQPWDALICTSHAVKAHVQRLLQAQAAHLQRRLGITRVVMPQMPVIPLGIHTDDFVFSADQRLASRHALNLAPDAVVVLFMGRLSFHAKAHPLAMYQALARAQLETRKEVVLVECGWHANDAVREAYAEAARAACPNVHVVTLDGRAAESRQTAWACADVFCSLSDNIQETFGITPIEAMAAGLPVVVSDWDGYKESVRDGIDGFRIPTLMPEPGMGFDLAWRHASGVDNYDMYCGHNCMLVAVDIEAATRAFVRLFEDKDLRARMGAAGRAHTRQRYDWREVISQYEQLWASLQVQRHAAARDVSRAEQTSSVPWPARLEPMAGFSDYPTALLSEDTEVEPTVLPYPEGPNTPTADQLVELERRWRGLRMVGFAQNVLLHESELRTILTRASEGRQTAGRLVASLPTERRAHALRGLLTLLKLGVIRRVSSRAG